MSIIKVGDVFLCDWCYQVKVTKTDEKKQSFIGIIFSKKDSLKGDIIGEWRFSGENINGFKEYNIKCLLRSPARLRAVA